MADHIDPVRLREQIAEFTATLERLRGVSADAVAGVAQVVRERDALRAEVEKLRAFKSYVHGRLDDAGVPVDPPGPHRDAGCRIGQRLDLMLVHYSNVTQPRASPGASGGGRDVDDHCNATMRRHCGRLKDHEGEHDTSEGIELVHEHFEVGLACGVIDQRDAEIDRLEAALEEIARLANVQDVAPLVLTLRHLARAALDGGGE